MFNIANITGGPPPVYTNAVEFTANDCEVRLIFHCKHPGDATETKAHVIMHPVVAKGLQLWLVKKIDAYEEEHGPINMPGDTELLEQFFGGIIRKEPPDDKKTDDDE